MTIRITCLNNDSVGMDGGFWGEHGISYLIEKEGQRILFDTGTSWDVLAHNLKQQETGLEDISHIVLSHGHYDHTGGLMGVLSQAKQPCIVADPLVFNRKFARHPQTGELHEIGFPHAVSEVEDMANLALTVDPVEILPGITVTGRISHHTSFEQPPQNMLVEIGGLIQPDSLDDDRSIVIDTGESLVLLCGCCHAGLINTLLHVRAHFGKPLAAILGGIHLVGAKPERITQTIAMLRDDFQPQGMYFNHCTGLEATVALINTFGERVKPCPVGTVLEY